MKRILFYTVVVLIATTVFARAWFFGPVGGEGFFGPDQGGGGGPTTDALVLEGGSDFLLLETGDYFLLE